MSIIKSNVQLLHKDNKYYVLHCKCNQLKFQNWHKYANYVATDIKCIWCNWIMSYIKNNIINDDHYDMKGSK